MKKEEAVRWRGKASQEGQRPGGCSLDFRISYWLAGIHPLAPAVGTLSNKPRAKSKFRVEWDLLFWVFGTFAMLYFTDFASHLLFNPVVKR